MMEEKDYGYKEVRGFEIIDQETGEKVIYATDSNDMRIDGKSLPRYKVAIDLNLIKFWIEECGLLEELEY